MSALALYIEDEGIPTTLISLVREHTEAIRPPRALWVPFILGRPLGAPDNISFQRKVLLTGLKLLEVKNGPVLIDFPDDAPSVIDAEEIEGVFCPISFGNNLLDAPINIQVIDEISQLKSWHDIFISKSGKTTLGVAGVGLEELVNFLFLFINDQPFKKYRDDLPLGNLLRVACEEIKTFYFEADSGQPGKRKENQVAKWFWHETAAGRLFNLLECHSNKHSDPDVRHFSKENLIPRLAKDKDH